MKLSAADQEIFWEKGILGLKAAIPRTVCAAIKSAVLAELDRQKLRVNGKPAASKLQHLPIFQQTGFLGQKVRVELGELFSEELLALMNSLAGTGLRPAHPHPQLLLSFPHKKDWSLERLNWHLDLAVPKTDQISGVQAFAILDTLAPRGGATLALAGSHKLPYVSGKPALSQLREHAIFRSLFDGTNRPPEVFFKSERVEGLGVQIVEMAGDAGDVYLMDLRVLHAPSVNATKNIRMMATNRFIR